MTYIFKTLYQQRVLCLQHESLSITSMNLIIPLQVRVVCVCIYVHVHFWGEKVCNFSSVSQPHKEKRNTQEKARNPERIIIMQIQL